VGPGSLHDTDDPATMHSSKGALDSSDIEAAQSSLTKLAFIGKQFGAPLNS